LDYRRWGDEFIIPENEELPIITHQKSSHGQAMEHAFMVNFMQGVANDMWEEYSSNT
jgi:hypothetical protein